MWARLSIWLGAALTAAGGLVACDTAAGDTLAREAVSGIPTAWPTQRADGYTGIWYANQRVNTEYVYKYSGGLATYCAKHQPLAVYHEEADTTFFVYGGSADTARALHIMVGAYDHAADHLHAPVALLDKETSDAHDNPVLAIDGEGRIWVFASAHGTARPAYVFRSVRPLDIGAWEMVAEFNFSYPQPWWIDGQGFLFLHTQYDGGRMLTWRTSDDGVNWRAPRRLAEVGEGHYQVSWPHAGKVGTAFNYHPAGKGLNHRTNLYYAETADGGQTWTAADGTPLETPLRSVANPALVHDYASEGWLVYMKDLNYDADGRPVILYVTARSWRPGEDGGPHTWHTARWTGKNWERRPVTTSDHNYDMGSLYITSESWVLLAPTDPGPQPFGAGGEIVRWTSSDQGQTWQRTASLTRNSARNHTYVRRPLNAAPRFFAFWADGDARRVSPVRLYRYDAQSDAIHQLPAAGMAVNATVP